MNICRPTIFALFFLSLVAAAHAEDAKQPRASSRAEAAQRPGWTLVFADEFDGKALDPVKWTPKDMWGRERNGELQAFVEDAVELRGDGRLRIRAEKRRALYDGKWRDYTSGIIISRGKFDQKFGRFEIRCRVPRGKGLWPAFWLLPEPLHWPPEIDVFEILGHQPTRIFVNHHWRDAQGKHQADLKWWDGPDFSADFHTIAIEWRPDRITWFIDDVARRSSTKTIPQQEPMFLIINLAVGGNWPGSPDRNTKFPSDLEVDYVRVYKQSDAGGR